jgi:hypothetical protein
MKRWCFRIVVFLFITVRLFWNDPGSSQDLQRGLRNYQEILSGRKKFEQLSPQEQNEVLIIFRRVKARWYSGKSSECRDAADRTGSAAFELSDYARRLINCAEAQDFTDDCSREFRRVRNAYSDYEDAVSAFNSYCR